MFTAGPMAMPSRPQMDDRLRVGPDARDTTSERVHSPRLMRLLDQHFGDGLVYLQSPEDRETFRMAIEEGLVEEDGYLTPAGFKVWHTSKA